MTGLDHKWMKLRAMAWLVFGRRAAAGAVFDAMLQRWPDDPYALASRAHLRMEAGEVGAALADSERLVAVEPAKAAHWFNRGFMLESAERWEEALEAFRRATAADPKLDRAWYGMGMVLIRLQRYDDAVVALKRNTELQPMSPYGWYQLARVHVDRQQPDEAVKIIRHLQGFEPKVAAQLARETGLVARVPSM
jgi:tetratricopeptide (TPR) repeat protein